MFGSIYDLSRRTFLLVGMMTVGVMSSTAQEKSMTMESCVQYALEHSPLMSDVKYDIEMLGEERRAATLSFLTYPGVWVSRFRWEDHRIRQEFFVILVRPIAAFRWEHRYLSSRGEQNGTACARAKRLWIEAFTI